MAILTGHQQQHLHLDRTDLSFYLKPGISMVLRLHCLGVSETEELLVEGNLFETGRRRLHVLLLLSHLLSGQDLVAVGVIGQTTS